MHRERKAPTSKIGWTLHSSYALSIRYGNSEDSSKKKKNGPEVRSSSGSSIALRWRWSPLICRKAFFLWEGVWCCGLESREKLGTLAKCWSNSHRAVPVEGFCRSRPFDTTPHVTPWRAFCGSSLPLQRIAAQLDAHDEKHLLRNVHFLHYHAAK